MIQITDKSKCCGCSACVTSCPAGCIDFNEDEQGFNYPIVDNGRCINCGLCEKVCPCLNQGKPLPPKKVYAAINPAENKRLNSSSGGIFTIIAEWVLGNNGIVFGVRFDRNWNVIHDYTESVDDIDKFRRSKYVQSYIGETFRQVRKFLNAGRLVLFSGTSCQIAGLKRFLNKEYENLLLIDVVCHGVPSPKIWREYLKYIIRPKGVDGKNTVLSFPNDMSIIKDISFRNKKEGWKKFGFELRMAAPKAAQNSVLNSVKKLDEEDVVFFQTVNENLYLQGFINNLYLRPSCFACPSKSGKCNSDFSLADFWAIDRFAPSLNDDKGVTLLYVNSQKGESLLGNLNLYLVELDKTRELNFAYSHSARVKYPVDEFWEQYSRKGIEVIFEICEKMQPNGFQVFLDRAKRFLKRKLR